MPLAGPEPVALAILAKAPVPGRVKTRLCPPCTPHQAAAIAAASLADTVLVAGATPASRRTLAIHGEYPAPAGWQVVAQRGDGLAERLAHAFADAAPDGQPTILIGMDTPQVSVADQVAVADGLDRADAVLGLAADGGWWTLALRDPLQAQVLVDVPMSTVDTGELTLKALRGRGLAVAVGQSLRDVDTAEDAWAVAAAHPYGAFAAAVRTHLRSSSAAVTQVVR